MVDKKKLLPLNNGVSSVLTTALICWCAILTAGLVTVTLYGAHQIKQIKEQLEISPSRTPNPESDAAEAHSSHATLTAGHTAKSSHVGAQSTVAKAEGLKNDKTGSTEILVSRERRNVLSDSGAGTILDSMRCLSCPPGPAGRDGRDGQPGLHGFTGPMGFKGERGPRGEPGREGAPGHPAIPGQPGDDGRDGIPGAKGSTGPIGPPGPPGEDGKMGEKGAIGAVGSKGEAGEPGPMGPPGKMATPYGGDTSMKNCCEWKKYMQINHKEGNQSVVMLGETDGEGNFIPLATGGIKGEKGDQGAIGKQGAMGLQGTQGAQGHTGEPGPMGARGEKGERGETGPQGPPGTGSRESKGAVYVRWGKRSCEPGAENIYSGLMGGPLYDDPGSGANYLCMPDKAQYDSDAKSHPARLLAGIYAASYYTGSYLRQSMSSEDKSLSYQDVPCAVCMSQYTTSLMIPARMECPAGWNEEYHGYLMSSYADNHRSEYVCIDKDVENGYQDDHQDGSRLTHVVATCDESPTSFGFCDVAGYEDMRVLSCVVCSK